MSTPEVTSTEVESTGSSIGFFHSLQMKIQNAYAWLFPSTVVIPENESGEVLRRALASKSWFDHLSSGYVEQPFWTKILIVSGVSLISLGIGLWVGAPLLSTLISLIFFVAVHLLLVAHEHQRRETAKILAEEAEQLVQDLEALKPLLDKGVAVVHQVSDELQSHSTQMKDNAEVLQEEAKSLYEQTERLGECVDGMAAASQNLVVKAKDATLVLEQAAQHVRSLDPVMIQAKVHVEGLGVAAEKFSESVRVIQSSQETYTDAITRFGIFVDEAINQSQLLTQPKQEADTSDDESFFRTIAAHNAELDENDRLIEEIQKQYGKYP